MNFQYTRLALFLLISLLHTCLWSQTYQPMPTYQATWEIARCWAFYPGGWHDRYTVEFAGGDTIINGHVYKKLNLVTHHAPGTQFDSVYTNYLGGMREASRRVYFISEYLCLDTIERVLYDFNPAAVGDTIYTQVLTNGVTGPIAHILTGVDSVWVGDEFHRRLHLTDENGFVTESWIEGVGSSMGLIYASYWILTDNSYDLNCFNRLGQSPYINPNPGYEFCLSPLPDINCDSTSSVSPIEWTDPFTIFPNPVFDEFYLEGPLPWQIVEVYNVWGQKIKTFSSGQILSLSTTPPGVYILRIQNPFEKAVSILKVLKI
jgi:hypothetical protein